MAARGEQFSAPLPEAAGHRKIVLSCRPSGPPIRELYEPIVAFVRAHLMTHYGHATPARTHMIGPGRPEPPRRNGVQITVDPRARSGRLSITARAGTWGGGDDYCLHVLRNGVSTVIAIEWEGSWIK